MKKSWAAACEAAQLTAVRLHDLRHTFASVLVSAGQSLAVVGAMLGHTQAQTTTRYAHLSADPLQKAADTAGAILTSKLSAEVIPFGKSR